MLALMLADGNAPGEAPMAMAGMAPQGLWTGASWGSPMASLAVLSLIFFFVLIIVVLSMRAKLKSDRLRLMEKALQADTVDDATRRVLLDQLSGRNRQRPEWLASLYQHLLFLSKNALFVVGWMGMFTGIGLVVVGMGFDREDLGFAGVLTALVSFGVVTVPMALREAERRRA